jgi:DNA-binding GntR family transcriptional regulator
VQVRIHEELALLDFTPPERLTLHDQVYNELRRLIMSGQLRPGQSISIRTLANSINVSPMPVRGALQRLVTEGALDVRPNRTFALPIQSPESFREIADLRAMLEGAAAERASPHLGRSDLVLLEDINRRMFDADRSDWTGYLDLNRQFHFHIYAAAGMPRFLRFIETLWLQIGPLLNLVTNREEMRSGLEAHEAAVKAIAAGDAAGLRAAVVRDIRDAAHVIISSLKRGEAPSAEQRSRKPPASRSPGPTKKLNRPVE